MLVSGHESELKTETPTGQNKFPTRDLDPRGTRNKGATPVERSQLRSGHLLDVSLGRFNRDETPGGERGHAGGTPRNPPDGAGGGDKRDGGLEVLDGSMDN